MFVTREELYRLVSERPLNKVAPELGLSATALARICQSHNIPYPGSGYWTKKAMGLPVETISLPPAGEGGDRIELAPRKASDRKRKSPQRPKVLEQEKLPAPIGDRPIRGSCPGTWCN